MSWAGPAALLLLLAACGTPPKAPPPATTSRLPPGNAQRDGPEANPPEGLANVPDAVPRLEPIRIGGPNKPYEVEGRTYVPLTEDKPVVERGLASWYGKKFHGRRTASGEAYNMYAMTAAHKTLPIPSYARIRNPANGREVIVRVNDRGPFAEGRIVDLSYTAALKLGLLGGVATVELERLTGDDIRSGRFGREPVLVAGAAGTSTGAPPARAGAAATAPDNGTVDPIASLAGAATVPAPATATLPVPVPVPDANMPATTPPPADAAPVVKPGPDTRPSVQEPAHTPAAAGYWLQLGAWRQREGALEFQRRTAEQQPWLAPLLAVYTERGLHKLQAGPWPDKSEAQNVAARVREQLQLVPTLVQKN